MKRRDVEHIFEDGTDPSFDALFAALREPDQIDPATASSHVAAAAALARQTPQTATTPDAAPAPWYRRVLVRGAGLGLTAKLLLGTAVAVAATGGAAAGGILPGPIQSAIADGASHIGLRLPNPRLATTTTATTLPDDDGAITGASTSTTSTTVPDDDDTTGPTPGTFAWTSTSCDAGPLEVSYRVTSDGELILGAITGDADDIDADDDRIRVDFDDVRVDIRIEGDRVTVDEDRDCGGTGSTTTSTTAPDDDDDDDDEGSDDHPAAGSHTWHGTSCDAAPISVAYTVTADGELILGAITGDVDDIDEDEDRIRVSFDDGVEVEIRITGSDVTTDVDRDCDVPDHDDEDEGTTTTTTQPSDDSDDD